MGEQAVVGHADADVDGEEVRDGEGGEVLPGEAEEGGDGPGVEDDHDGGGGPVDAALLVGAAHAQVLLDAACDLGGAAGSGDAVGGEGVGGDGRGDGDGSLRAGPAAGASGMRRVGVRVMGGLAVAGQLLDSTLARRGSAGV